jgi:transposase-like protein
MDKEKESISTKRHSRHGNHDKRFIAQVVQEVQQGKPRAAACQEYDISSHTLKNWLVNNKLGLDKLKTQAVISMQTKRSIVRALQNGRMSMQQVRQVYGIKSEAAIRNWVGWFKQENDELGCVNDNPEMKKNKPAQTPSTPQETEMKALQKALADARLKIAALNTLIDVAEEQLNINIRKKPGAKQSND